jgi:hypothetical protein
LGAGGRLDRRVDGLKNPTISPSHTTAPTGISGNDPLDHFLDDFAYVFFADVMRHAYFLAFGAYK